MTVPSCETPESTSNPTVGVVLTLLSCLCYASGNCLQRYALLLPPQSRFGCFGMIRPPQLWLVGASVYFSANGIFAVALSFAPVSVLSAVFALTIVANAACARIFLGDRVPPSAYPGYAMVLAGSVVFSNIVNAPVCQYGNDELLEITTSPGATVFWVVMTALMGAGAVFAWFFERSHVGVVTLLESKGEVNNEEEQPTEETNKETIEENGNEDKNDKDIELNENDDKIPTTESEENVATNTTTTTDPSNMENANEASASQQEEPKISQTLLLIARLLYPGTLGITEGTGTLMLKAVNSLFTTTALPVLVDGININVNVNVSMSNATVDIPTDDIQDPVVGLWVTLFVLGAVVMLAIIVWLRLTYKRFEISGAFPVEFGVLTFVSVVGGFAIYRDYQYIEGARAWAGVGIAGALILGGIIVVAMASWKASLKKKRNTTTDNSSALDDTMREADLEKYDVKKDKTNHNQELVGRPA